MNKLLLVDKQALNLLFEANVREIQELFLKKNSGQYAKESSSAFSAFHKCAAIKYQKTDDTATYLALQDCMLKHLAHFQGSTLNTPKIKESLMDIATYCIIAACMVDIQNEEENAELIREMCNAKQNC